MGTLILYVVVESKFKAGCFWLRFEDKYMVFKLIRKVIWKKIVGHKHLVSNTFVILVKHVAMPVAHVVQSIEQDIRPFITSRLINFFLLEKFLSVD